MKKTIFTVVLITSLAFTAFAGQGVSYYKAGFPDVAKQILISELTYEPNVAETAFYLGNAYFLENRVDSAAFYFGKGLAANPAYPFNEIGQAMLAMKTAPEKEMDARIKAIINNKNYREYKKNANLYIAIAYAYLYNGLNTKALEYKEKAQALNAKNPEVYILWGDIVEKQDIGTACGYYEMAALYDENCIESYIKYARAYKSVNAKLAIDKLTQLKQKDQNFMLADRELGDIYYFTNDFGKAAENYDKYLKSGNKTYDGDLVKYAMALFWNRDYQKSVDVALLGTAKNPRNPALNRLLLYNYVELKNYGNALKAADNLFNNSDNAVILFLDHRYHAHALKESSKVELAAAAYAKALEIDPTKMDLWKDVSDMYKSVNDYPQAISAYTKFKNSSTDANEELNQLIALGTLYYNWGRDTTVVLNLRRAAELKADSVFGLAAEKFPTDYRGNFWRARANLSLEGFDNANGLAKPYYEQTITFIESKADARYNPTLIECFNYLAAYYFKVEDLKTSLEYWNKILAIDPNHENAKISAKYIEEQLKPKKSNK